jgi:diguanylate cyclase (GGDEF)-like protein
MDDRTASPDLSFDSIAQSVASAVSRLLQVPVAALIHIEDSGTVSIASASDTTPPIETAAALTFLQATHGSPEVVLVADVSRRSGPVAEAAQALGIGSLLLVPVRFDTAEFGLMVVGASGPRQFTNTHIEIAATLAEQAATNFAGMRLLGLERAGRRRAQALLQVAQAVTQSSDLNIVLTDIRRAAASFSVAHRCSIFLTDSTGRPRPVTGWDRLDGPQPGRLAHFLTFQFDLLREERAATSEEIVDFMAQLPLVLDNVSHGPRAIQPWAEEFGFRSVAIYPLTTRRGTVGIMNLSAHDQVVHFPADEVEAMSAIALQAAAVIEHLSLLEHVRQQAERDGLTGLYNRRFALEALRVAIDAAHLANRSLAVAMLDVDGMKQLNDSRGHSAGDAILQRVAAALTTAFHDTDTIARYGGDEFLVLMPDATVHTALDRCEGLLVTLAEDEPSAGASIGIAMFPADGASAAALMESADAAMYAAKRAGNGGIALARDHSTV